MIDRLRRSPTISLARARMARCVDIVFWGTSIRRASSPAGTPSGSRATSRRKVWSRVDWASAARVATTSMSSIYPDYQMRGCLQLSEAATMSAIDMPWFAPGTEKALGLFQPIATRVSIGAQTRDHSQGRRIPRRRGRYRYWSPSPYIDSREGHRPGESRHLRERIADQTKWLNGIPRSEAVRADKGGPELSLDRALESEG